MIYFDNAATSLQKPREVYWAMQAAMQQAGGYGRSGHRRHCARGNWFMNAANWLRGCSGWKRRNRLCLP